MKFVIRVDDLGWTGREHGGLKEEDPDLDRARQFHEALGLPYLGAVIASIPSPVGRRWLRSAQGLTVAIHGWDHGRGRPKADEFDGLTLNQMRDRIADAQHAVGPSPHFVPPFNACPEILPEAAWLEGVRFIWGAPSSWPTPPEPTSLRSVRFIPAWAPLYGASRWCQSLDCKDPLVVAVQPWLDMPGLAVLTLHLTWEFARDPELAGLRHLAGIVRSRVISPADFIKEIPR